MLREEALESMADLLMSEEFATSKRLLATIHGFGEAGFFLEVALEDVLQEFVGIAALARSGVSELRFEFMPEVYFHGFGPFVIVARVVVKAGMNPPLSVLYQ